MRTEDDLRSALTALERQAPDMAAVLPGLRGRTARRRRRRAVYGLALPAAAAAAAVAVLIATTGAPSARPVQATGPAPAESPSGGGHAGTGTQTTLTARDVLLAAANKAASTPQAAGRYWRVQEEYASVIAAGTRAHPYDIFANTVRHDEWYPVASGQRMWDISQLLGAVPATPADAAAWRAAGSPASWPLPEFRKMPSGKKNTITTASQARLAIWQDLNGVVGYVEGDEPGLTAAQFRALPASQAGLYARLRHYAMLTWSATHPGAGGATVDELIWAEAISLLSDPVSPQVKAAAYRIMAALPGVRSAGEVRDPLGRTGQAAGYPVAPGSQGEFTGQSEDVAIVDPASGALLAEESVVTAPGTTTDRVGQYYGTEYPGQIRSYSAVISAAWTNASPRLSGIRILGG
ncbi:MAG: CU044_5270 family protein [Streptosporangiaceae bacterium]|nr:CU044_5270 family protein [Streptosporangiaceae bacterium]